MKTEKNLIEPMVSVCIQTYQQKDFIEHALNSVLMQETEFSFEILIGEDESTDGTRSICIEYEKKYPDKIRLFLNSRKNVIYINNYPTGRWNFINNIKKSRGKYIAILPGDDYWTDPYKLQKQVEFLEANPEYTICFCNVEVVYDDESKYSHQAYGDLQLGGGYLKTIPTPKEKTDIYTLARGNYIHTPGVLFRNWIKDLCIPEYMYEVSIGDWPMHLRTASLGYIRFINETMAAYRVHNEGIWSNQTEVRKFRMSILQYPPLLASPLFPKDIKAIWRDLLPKRISAFERRFADYEESRRIVMEIQEKLKDIWPSFTADLEHARRTLKRKNSFFCRLKRKLYRTFSRLQSN